MTGTRRIRVLVVDDSAFVRKAIERMLGTVDDIEVVGFAADGEEGLVKARELRPDVVTLDIKMPRLGGLETLERLMAEQPVPVLLMSTLTQEGAEVTLRGLELGAMDFVDKSSVQPMSMLSLAEELVAKVRALGGARVHARPRPARKGAREVPGAPAAECVVVAASRSWCPACPPASRRRSSSSSTSRAASRSPSRSGSTPAAPSPCARRTTGRRSSPARS
jgi:two-component system chemotaxis response regulator CheB